MNLICKSNVHLRTTLQQFCGTRQRVYLMFNGVKKLVYQPKLYLKYCDGSRCNVIPSATKSEQSP
jgi:hypothetical protein